MLQTVRNKIGSQVIQWIVKPRATYTEGLIDFERLQQEILPGDVLLVEGQSQVSRIIQTVTQSRWSHSAICVGCYADFAQYVPEGVDLSDAKANPNKPYLVEAELGKGTILEPVEQYHDFRVRVCRATGLSEKDRNIIVEFVTGRLGAEYNVRQLLDLARFLFPYEVLPRRWRSSLFEHNAGPETKIVCSTLIADAYQSVKFPILPILSPTEEEQSGRKGHPSEHRLFKRNSKLFSPADFDISPFFSIVKFPKFTWGDGSHYHQLPWAKGSKSHPNDPDISPEYTAAAQAEELKHAQQHESKKADNYPTDNKIT